MTPQEIMENNEMVDKINAAINSKDFSDVQREVLNLRMIEGLKYEAIAKKLDMNLNNVKGIIFRTREILESKIKA